ncbi:MAG: hypothetical protein HQL14_05360 [Candidatus Omnitrophica bacterium]|nr:hypothetical protein [Candidatus Omnitrophota bacterium]
MLKTVSLRHKTCAICGDLVWTHRAKYCQRCSVFTRRLQRLSRKAARAILRYVHKNGFICYYTRMPLEMFDTHSPWYCVFDHWIPHDPRKVVITSSLINDMKSDLSEDEFWYYVIALANNKLNHIKVREKTLKYWDRDYSPKALYPDGWEGPTYGPVCNGRCHICGKRILGDHLRYCRPCAILAHRIHIEHVLPEVKIKLWAYIRKNGCVCYYTGMRLELDDPRSPWYCVFDHCNPHDPRKLVITSALINEMKSDLSESEFWYYIKALADYKLHGTRIRRKMLVFWYRLS